MNDLTTLNNKSQMLKHILTDHPDEDINVKFGVKIIKNCRTSFERQIYESVAIQQAREQYNILNSCSEYNKCSLERLSTQKLKLSLAKLTNLRRIENKVIQIDEVNQDLEWEELRDWECVLREHKDRIEQEERELNVQLDRQTRKQEGW